MNGGGAVLDRTALHLVIHDRDTDLARRTLAEAAYDTSEREESPEDRIAYYLEKIEIVASHWADVIGVLATSEDRTGLVGRGDLFVFVDVCVRRVDGTGAAQMMADPCFGLWGSFRRAMAALEGWEGDPHKGAQFVNIMFVSCIVLRRVYAPSLPWTPSACERIILERAKSLPFPLDTTVALRDQAQTAARNLRWLHEELAKSKGVNTFLHANTRH